MSCGDAPQFSNAAAFQIAATDSEVAVAWIEQSATAHGKLHITRLSPSLDFVSASEFVDSTLESLPLSLDIAPLPSGWVAAGMGVSEVFVHGVDATGGDLGRLTIDQLPGGEGGPVVLAPRPTRGPLVVWQALTSTIRAVVVSDDGRSTSTPRDLPLPSTWPQQLVLNAVFVGGAFYVLTTDWDSSVYGGPLRMLRVEADGTPGAAYDVLPGVHTWDARLVAGAADLQLILGGTVDDFAGIWQRIDATGAALSPPSVVYDLVKYYTRVSAVAFGTDTVVWLSNWWDSSLGGGVALVRVDATGNVVTPAYQVASGPVSFSTWGAIARRGPDVVVGWTNGDNGKVRLARVTP
jgi:hypothetical protein